MVLIVFGIYWVASYKVDGKSLYQVTKGFVSSGKYKEGMRDIRMFLGGFLKTVGEQIQEDVTETEKKQLDNLIQKEMSGETGKKLIEGAKK